MDIVRMTVWGKNVGSLLPWFGKDYEKVAQYSAGSGSICIFTDGCPPSGGDESRISTIILDFRMVHRCAVLVIPRGAGTARPADAGFLARLRGFCREHALVVEEIPTLLPVAAAAACPE